MLKLRRFIFFQPFNNIEISYFLHMHLGELLFITLFLVCITNVSSKVSLDNVKLFFQLTYDQNEDEKITWKEFCDYYKLL